jgi:Tol biopolymer transport system component
MKTRLSIILTLVIGTVMFLTWTMAGQKAEAKAVVQSTSHVVSTNVELDSRQTLGLSYTVGITFTPVSTIYLPLTQRTFVMSSAKIAFTSDDGNDGEIWTMNADGTEPVRLTDNSSADIHPAWSPNHTRIAFGTHRDGNDEIYVMNADGSGPTRLTDNLLIDGNPAWSPDGTRIAFYSNRDGNKEIYVMNADGTGQTRLTNDPASDTYPAWSPDGNRIAFTSDRNGNVDIYVMNASEASPQTDECGYRSVLRRLA